MIYNPVIKILSLFVLWVCCNFKIYALEDISWIDLPNYKLLDLPLDRKFKTLENLFAIYHELNKNDLGKIDARCKSLSTINSFIVSIVSEYTSKQKPSRCKAKIKAHQLITLRKLAQTASAKRNYLYKIKNYYANFGDDYVTLANYFKPEISGRFSAPLTLNKNPFYNPYKNTLTGSYWIEVFDPCHRDLTEYRQIWQALVDNKPPFFLWLETQVLPNNISRISYIPESELDTVYKAKICNGKLFVFDKKVNDYRLATTKSDHKYGHIFVIMPDKTLRVSLGSQEIHHSSLTHGKAVIGVGAMRLRLGKVYKISYNSGHYLPQEMHKEQTAQLLLAMGLELPT